MTSAFQCITASATPIVNEFGQDGGQCYKFGGSKVTGRPGANTNFGSGRRGIDLGQGQPAAASPSYKNGNANNNINGGWFNKFMGGH